jgi:AmmeMemoRadiSam system protein A
MMTIDSLTQSKLFELVRRSLGQAVAGDDGQNSKVTNCREVGGVFVTLRRNGKLRGCMGTFHPTGTLEESLDHAARMAACDPRFRGDPITPEEIPQLDVEISILSPPEATSDPLSLVIGTHGIWIRHGQESGCFLPKVAVEQNWNAEEFLSNCCARKAGLPPDAWKNPDAGVFLFKTETFKQSGS